MEQNTKPENKTDKLIGIITGAVVFFITSYAVQQFFAKPTNFDNELMSIASEMNKSCPIMVDSETRLDNTLALPNMLFQYNYTLVNIEQESIDSIEIKEFLAPRILNTIKTNPDMKGFRDNNVTLGYNYNDRNGTYLFKLIFTPADYK